MKKKINISLIILGLIILALSFEIGRDTFTKKGDFIGYVLAGNLVIEGDNIYNQPAINTWPPFFSIVSVPIAVVDNFNIYLIRFIWLIMCIYAMFHIIAYTTKLTIKRKLKLFPLKQPKKLTESNIYITHFIILIPILIIFKYILDNLSNIQINIFMLLIVMSSIYYFSKGKDMLAAIILAFGISIKVYPVFLLLYFVVKREFKISVYTVFFCILFSAVPFLVFGYAQTLEYYSFWYNYNVAPFASVAHKNQSFFSMMRSLLTHDSPGLNQPLNQAIYLNVVNLTIEQVKIVSYAIVAIAGSFVVALFRNKLAEKNNLKSFLEYAFIMTIIPILSPLAWKAYFIFLFSGYFINYLFIYQYKNTLNNVLNYYLKISFYISILLVVFTSDLFLGKYLSDIFETFSCITIGTILLAINILIFYVNINKYDRKLKH